MNVDIANMMLYIKGSTDHTIREGVERTLRRDPGVIAVGLPHAGRDHLVMVGYNPRKTSGAFLVKRAEASGVHAKAVGF